MQQPTLTIEIFSDVVCPFCYIGKRQLEAALSQFDHKDQVKIQWKSFQLDPSLHENQGVSLYESLSARKGWSMAQTVQISNQVTSMAAQSGLGFHFETAIPANSFNAHRLIHLAKKYDQQDQMKEQLLNAYFVDGKDIDDQETLIKLGLEVGLPAHAIKEMFEQDTMKTEVEADLQEAQAVGIKGVPFFIFDRKYVVSGAQGAEIFGKALKATYDAILAPEAELVGDEGQVCTPDSDC
jgi:predicted DsbA family dithiol-disulfide isomerase